MPDLVRQRLVVDHVEVVRVGQRVAHQVDLALLELQQLHLRGDAQLLVDPVDVGQAVVPVARVALEDDRPAGIEADELERAGSRPTHSALSVLSGVHRKDVRSLEQGGTTVVPGDFAVDEVAVEQLEGLGEARVGGAFAFAGG